MLVGVIGAITIAGSTVAVASPTPAGAPQGSDLSILVDRDRISTAHGREVFRALTFGQGDLGADLHQRGFYGIGTAVDSGITANNGQAVMAAVDTMLDDVQATRPTVFLRLSSAAKSGNPYSLQEELRAVGAAFDTMMDSKYGSAAITATPVEDEFGVTCGLALAVGVAAVLVVTLFAAANVAVAANAAAGANVAYAQNWVKSSTGPNASALEREEQLAYISQTLAR